jgi:sugar/nucleoside kinase (ribokinase family)
VETPHGRAESVLGGSSIYFSLAASLFTDVRLVGVVGDDFDMRLLDPLTAKRIDTRGVEVRKGSKTFRWEGKYQGAMNEAETVGVALNVLEERGASIPREFRDSRHIFLANSHPDLQRSFAEQFPQAELIVADTMNLWIETHLESLRRTLGIIHGLVINEGEARLLTRQQNLFTAGKRILEMGPGFVAIKKGEHGGILVSRDDLFVFPAYPTEKAVDPTGCGDTFAGAMIGYLVASGGRDKATLRAAMARGSIAASFVIESFSIDALSHVTAADIERRLSELRDLARFE